MVYAYYCIFNCSEIYLPGKQQDHFGITTRCRWASAADLSAFTRFGNRSLLQTGSEPYIPVGPGELPRRV